MDVFVVHKNVAEHGADVFAYRFVMIARNENDFLAMPGPAQHLLHKSVLCRRPMYATAAHRPQVNNVAEQEDVLGRIFFQEFKKMVRLARLGTQVNVGREDRANQLHGQPAADVALAWISGDSRRCAFKTIFPMGRESHGSISAL